MYARLSKAATAARQVVVMGILITALTLLGMVVGCDLREGPAKAYYGPPPSTDIEEDDEFGVYYGCPPVCPADVSYPDVDVVEDLPSVPDEGSIDLIYGPPDVTGEQQPQPVDTVEDLPAEPDFVPFDVIYGPPDISDAQPDFAPTDLLDSVPEDVQLDVSAAWYGPPPPPMDVVGPDTGFDSLDASVLDCAPVGIYGPQPCDSDEFCEEQWGEGWYCDLDNSFDNGCGGKIVWPMCKEKAGQ